MFSDGGASGKTLKIIDKDIPQVRLTCDSNLDTTIDAAFTKQAGMLQAGSNATGVDLLEVYEDDTNQVMAVYDTGRVDLSFETTGRMRVNTAAPAGPSAGLVYVNASGLWGYLNSSWMSIS